MEKLDKNDARKVDSKTLQYLRDRAIKLRESGVSVGTQTIWPSHAFTLGQLTHHDLASVRI